jgi:acyl carrier protein
MEVRLTMSMLDEVVRRVRKQIRAADRSIKIDESSTLDDLGLSSLQVADVVFSLEEDFELEFDSERAARIKTLGDLVALVDESLGDRAPEALAKLQTAV